VTALAAAAAAIIAGAAGWFLGRSGETALADTWQQTAVDGMGRVADAQAEATVARAELHDTRERLDAWEALTRTSDGVYGPDGQTATWADLGLYGGTPGGSR
jgi:hypothetical protein